MYAAPQNIPNPNRSRNIIVAVVAAVVIVVVMCVLSILRLKQGAVKAEDLAAKKEEIVRQAITDTTADEAEAA